MSRATLPPPVPASTAAPATNSPYSSLWNVTKQMISRITTMGAKKVVPPIYAEQVLESHPIGYPRFSALLAIDPSFSNLRRFAHIRMRILLEKQDEIVVLEEELARIDRDETCNLYLASRRTDNNTGRREVIENLGKKIAEYDDEVERYHRTMSYNNAQRRDIQSLEFWLGYNAFIKRQESAFLSKTSDLMNISREPDTGVLYFSPLVETVVIFIYNLFRIKLPNRYSIDENVCILNNNAVHAWSRLLIVLLAVSLLLIPLVLLYFLPGVSAKFLVIMLAEAVFIFMLSFLGRAKTSELIMASACYMAVMVVFVVGNGPGQPGQPGPPGPPGQRP